MKNKIIFVFLLIVSLCSLHLPMSAFNYTKEPVSGIIDRIILERNECRAIGDGTGAYITAVIYIGDLYLTFKWDVKPNKCRLCNDWEWEWDAPNHPIVSNGWSSGDHVSFLFIDQYFETYDMGGWIAECYVCKYKLINHTRASEIDVPLFFLTPRS